MTDSDRVEAPELRPPLAVGGRFKRRMVLAWAMWDWGSSAYSAVITSFVFGPYVVRGVVGDAQQGGLTAKMIRRPPRSTLFPYTSSSISVVAVSLERKSGVEGKRVGLGGWRIIKTEEC